jgi:predicted nucleotide-binding protein
MLTTNNVAYVSANSRNFRTNIYAPPEIEELLKKRLISMLRKAFIVHGRDSRPVAELKSILKELEFDPIVLHEQPSGSRTIVEKLEKNSDVDYAFVILTPDDVLVPTALGYQMDKQKGMTREMHLLGPRVTYRARQNVVLEFGYFIGKLGRDRVCCLLKGDVELPSDMQGIVYVPFKQSINEVRGKIADELKAAGYRIDIHQQKQEDHGNELSEIKDDIEMLKRRGIVPT